MNSHRIIYISDGTGITAETLGNSLLSQFPNCHFEIDIYPYIDTEDKAYEIRDKILNNKDDEKPIIISSLVDKRIREILSKSEIHFFDLFEQFIPPLSKCLNTTPSPEVGKVHSMSDSESYAERIDAVNFSLACDDGLGIKHYKKADVILIGVSRSGKTPTSLYLALNFGILCANYPFIDDDLLRLELPDSLIEHQDKLFGLTISSNRLSNIRQARRALSQYADLKQCEKEINYINKLYKRYNIPHLDTSERSIEEIATIIISTMHLKRHQA